ncbi:hypothetical protein [Streptomyces phage phiScoe23]|nr:hypothetical protein [Streptomyces phage phiScoe23]
MLVLNFEAVVRLMVLSSQADWLNW